jgi:hypothetical protein
MLVLKRITAIPLFVIPVFMVIQFVFVGLPAFYRIMYSGAEVSAAYKTGEIIGYLLFESVLLGVGWICYKFGLKLWKSTISAIKHDPEILDDILLEEKE